MISRLTLSSLVFAFASAATLVCAASVPSARVDSTARQVQLEHVFVAAKRLPSAA